MNGSRRAAAQASARGVAQHSAYQRTGSIAPLEAAIDSFREAAETAPADDPERLRYLSNHGGVLLLFFDRLGDADVLDQAIARLREAVAATPDGHPLWPLHLANLGLALHRRFERGKLAADLDEAVALGSRAVDAASRHDPQLPMYLSNLGDALRARGELTGQLMDLDQAVTRLAEAVRIVTSRDLSRPLYISNLGNALLAQFEHTGQLPDLNQAITTFSAAVAALPAHAPERHMYLSNLANALRNRFEHTGQLPDLDEAIARLAEAVETVPADHARRFVYLSNLAIARRARFERTGRLDDLDQAISALDDAAAAAPADHPGQVTIASNLGNALLSRFDQTGDLADLDRAIGRHRAAADAVSASRLDRVQYRGSLALALQTRFEQTGQLADLDQAITLLSEAAEATPAVHPRRPIYLSNLGGALTSRFGRAGQLADLDQAITVLSAGAAAAPADHPGQPLLLANLGTAYRHRFARTKQAADLDEAIDAGERSVTLAPEGDPRLAAYRTNLANALSDRYNLTGRAADLDQAIIWHTEAMEATPADHVDRPRRLSNLGAAHGRRFALTRRQPDLDQAIARERAAVDATPANHPDRAVWLFNLGIMLRIRFATGGDEADLDQAIKAFREGAELPTAAPGRRVAAARSWGQCAVAAGNFASAADGYATAIEQLPVIAWHGLDQATREHHLQEWSGLGPDAAVAAIAARQPTRAVELLEAGRSVLWTQALHLRHDLAALREVAPELAARLAAARLILDAPVAEESSRHPPAETGRLLAAERRMLDQRRQAGQDWDDAVAQVRQLADEKFRNFLRPVPFDELRKAADRWPVVIVNASLHGGNALIITPSGRLAVRPVHLPDAGAKAVTAQADALLSARRRRSDLTLSRAERDDARLMAFDVLAWCWSAIAEPVLTALGHLNTPAGEIEDWPRVWWCPVGPAAALPLHAAGLHPRASARPEAASPDFGADTVAGRVISSYTPTLAALARTRSSDSSGSVPEPPVRQLGVGVPDAPSYADAGPLRAATADLEAAARYLRPPPAQTTQLLGPAATRQGVLAALPGHSWLHLSCHGVQDPDDPSRSAFLLHDQRLTLADLTALDLPATDLAYLAACQTATGDRRLPDEALHLAGALQLTGYRHVLAALWKVADREAPAMADSTYAHLLDPDTGQPQSSRAACALHQAVAQLYRKRPGEPLLWAPYIHLGP